MKLISKYVFYKFRMEYIEESYRVTLSCILDNFLMISYPDNNYLNSLPDVNFVIDNLINVLR